MQVYKNTKVLKHFINHYCHKNISKAVYFGEDIL